MTNEIVFCKETFKMIFLKEKEEMTKEKLREKQQKRVEDKVRKSGGSSSVKSKKSKGVPKDNLQLEKERLKQLKEQEKQVSVG